jgi:hypothetical protein
VVFVVVPFRQAGGFVKVKVVRRCGDVVGVVATVSGMSLFSH